MVTLLPAFSNLGFFFPGLDFLFFLCSDDLMPRFYDSSLGPQKHFFFFAVFFTSHFLPTRGPPSFGLLYFLRIRELSCARHSPPQDPHTSFSRWRFFFSPGPPLAPTPLNFKEPTHLLLPLSLWPRTGDGSGFGNFPPPPPRQKEEKDFTFCSLLFWVTQSTHPPFSLF